MKLISKFLLITSIARISIAFAEADPVYQPHIELNQGSNSTLSIDWKGVAGRTYFLQSSSDLRN
jgi:hypothetical protein